MLIKRPRTQAETAPGPTPKDRESLDFCRLFKRGNNEIGPVPGVSYAKLLRIAGEVCHRPIRELTEIRSKGEIRKIRERIELEKYGRK